MKPSFYRMIATLLCVSCLSGCAVIWLGNPPEANISGQTVDPSGAPLAGVSIRVFTSRPYITIPPLMPISYPATASTVSDESGHFKLKFHADPPFRLVAVTHQDRPRLSSLNEIRERNALGLSLRLDP